MALPKERLGLSILVLVLERAAPRAHRCFHNAATLCRIYEAAAVTVRESRAINFYHTHFRIKLKHDISFRAYRPRGFIGRLHENPITRVTSRRVSLTSAHRMDLAITFSISLRLLKDYYQRSSPDTSLDLSLVFETRRRFELPSVSCRSPEFIA